MITPRIFILNKKRNYDYSSLNKFAKTNISITEGNLNFKALNDMQDKIEDVLYENKFEPELDFIALTSLLPLAFVLGVVLKKHYYNQTIKVLLFNAKTHLYELRDFKL